MLDLENKFPPINGGGRPSRICVTALVKTSRLHKAIIIVVVVVVVVVECCCILKIFIVSTPEQRLL